MNVYIEFVMIGAIILVFFLWAVWKNITDWFYRWRYKVNNEKRKRREEERREELGRRKPELESTSDSIPRPSQPEGEQLLPTTDVNSVGKNSKLSGKSRIFSRINRRK